MTIVSNNNFPGNVHKGRGLNKSDHKKLSSGVDRLEFNQSALLNKVKPVLTVTYQRPKSVFSRPIIA